MPSRRYSTQVTADTTLTTTSETVVATLSGITTSQAGQTIALRGQATITTGGSTTAITLRVRRDSVSGTVVGEAIADQIEAAAGSTETHDIYAEDTTRGEGSGFTYVLTAQQTAAAANGSALQASLEANVGP